MKRISGVILTVIVWASVAFAQYPNTGFPPFGSFENGTFDSVNRQNLNTHFSIPIVSVPGRGTNFSFAIVYDSLNWVPTGDPLTWAAISDNPSDHTGWGWKLTPTLGSITYRTNTQQTKCFDELGWYWGWITTEQEFAYLDPSGTYRSFGVSTTDNSCTGNYTSTFPGYARDGSGYKIMSSSTVRTGSGISVSPDSGTTDPNGNQISAIVVNSSETDWKDTAGRIVLKVIKNSSSIDYLYQDKDGVYRTTTVTLQSLPIRTKFDCAVGESGGTANVPVRIELPNGQYFLFEYEPSPDANYPNHYTGRLKKVTLPTGGTYTYEYPGANDSINCTTGETTRLTRTVNDGSSSSVWNFAVHSEQAEREVWEITPEDKLIAFTFSGDGKTLAQKIYDGNSDSTALLRTVSTAYSGSSLPFTKTDTLTLEDNSQSKVEADIDAYGNALETREYAFGAGAPGDVVRTTTASYTASDPTYSARNILDRLKQKLVKDKNGVVKSRTVITYDLHNNTYCPTATQHDDVSYGCSFNTRGNPSSVTTYADAATPGGATTRNMYYDSLGNLRKVDGNIPQRTWTYSATTQFAYPDSSTIGTAVTLTTSATYNSYTGLVTKTTDENGKETEYSYQPVTNRLSQVKRPDNALINYEYDDAARKLTVKTPLQGTSQVQQISLYDGLGRLIKASSADTAGSIISNVETQYDSMGRAYKVSNPYTGSAQYWTETRFDVLGRPTVLIPPDGTAASNNTSYSYAGNTVTVTDPAGKLRRTYTDALGRLIQVDEPGLDAGRAGSGTVTISGSENTTQVVSQGPAPGSVTIALSGSERSTQVTTQNATSGTGNVTINGATQTKPHRYYEPECNCFVNETYVNGGIVTITVNGYSKSVSYAESTTSGLAASLAGAFNSDPNAPVYASSSSNVVYLTSRLTGAGTNYSLSTSCTYDSGDGFTGCAFSGTRSGPTLTGGQDAVTTTAYDTGIVTLTVNGFSKSVSYAQGTSAQSLATSLASAFNGDGNSPVTIDAAAAPSIALTARQAGQSTNYGFSSSTGTNSGYFSGTSFWVSPGSGALAGGHDVTYLWLSQVLIASC